MPNILITGANRGIGLEFVRQYAADGWTVHATCRSPEGAEDLNSVAGEVTVHMLDVKDRRAIRQLADSLDMPFDIVIANAGIGGRKPDGSMQTFGELHYESWLETLEVNTLGATATAEAFAPHLKRSEQKKLVCISSQMGSIDDTSGGAVAYRTSKAALNMAMQASAAMLNADGIATVVLHPGWVKTEMGGSMAPLSPENSVKGMRQVIDTLAPTERATFLNYTGSEIPW